MKTSLLSALKKFLAVGMTAVFLDWAIYLVLTYFFGIGMVISKSLSYTSGTLFAFIANGAIVFQTDLELIRFLKHLILYMFSFLANTLVFASWESNFSLNSPMILGVALLTTTCVSTLINFTGMRYWVFANKGSNRAHS